MSFAATRTPSFARDSSLRLPVVRNRSRTLAGIGVIALCALLIAALYAHAGHRRQVLALSHDIPAGHVIKHDDLRAVGIATDSPIASVQIANAPTIMGKIATSRLSAGTILTPSAVAPTAPTAPGQAVVGIALKRGQYPAALHVGDQVLVVITPSTGTSTAASDTAASTPPSATVSDLGTPDDTTGTITASLTLDADNAPAVATAGSASTLSLVVVGR